MGNQSASDAGQLETGWWQHSDYEDGELETGGFQHSGKRTSEGLGGSSVLLRMGESWRQEGSMVLLTKMETRWFQGPF